MDVCEGKIKVKSPSEDREELLQRRAKDDAHRERGERTLVVEVTNTHFTEETWRICSVKCDSLGHEVQIFGPVLRK